MILLFQFFLYLESLYCFAVLKNDPPCKFNVQRKLWEKLLVGWFPKGCKHCRPFQNTCFV